ncbi:hypothetical protein SMSP2_01220 [Limihaloglobus sulfuriphilus]|uniref:DUF4340 domain-containing protein n=1 Tax=Limihaloglobus sulfuriphilus TaxID=1851148 RepID=A0A1Q2ME90_9BACT|nr:DUF4340 domain-containing protein [Limihaloglobus sulfuriphilus]AQQ70858.1 hypothetical protein SMSP2_01220 [Limihaloglobus sulfuriphilus]
MTDKKLTTLGIIAVVMVVLAVIVSQAVKKRPAPSGSVDYLIQGLNPESINKISIKSADDELVIQKSQGKFVIPSKSSYPAKVSAVNTLITDLMDIRVKEQVTDNQDNYADLEVTEETAANTVKLLGNEDSVITGISIGKSADGGGVYVKMLDDANVYLTQSRPWIRTSATDYMDTQLADVKKDDIEYVQVKSADGSYRITNAGGGPELSDVPEGRKAKQSELNSILGALSYLSFSDVAAAADKSDLKFDSAFVCRLKDTTVYTFDIAKDGEDTYLKVKAEFTGDTQIMKERREESEEELKEKEAKLLAIENAQNYAARHKGWVYKIESYSAEKLIKPYDSLLEEPEPETEDKAEAEAGEPESAPEKNESKPVSQEE